MNGLKSNELALDQLDTRSQLMLDVTYRTLQSDPELRLCEGLRLIEAARTAVARLEPAAIDTVEVQIIPVLRSTLLRRFGVPEELSTLN